jgi:hypothetical protein
LSVLSGTVSAPERARLGGILAQLSRDDSMRSG